MDFVRPTRSVALSLVSGRGHYDLVIQAVMAAERSVWIATANLKELMVEDPRAVPGRRRGGRGSQAYRSILEVFDEMAGRGVELRILHASPPSGPFRAEFEQHPRLHQRMALRMCPRVHLKAVIIDGARLYLGSANWTGAGLGAKGTGRRNFELGLCTSDDLLLDDVQALYDRIWQGAECAACRLRDVCEAPLDGATTASPARRKR